MNIQFRLIRYIVNITFPALHLKQFATIVLVVFVLGGECRIHGGERRLYGVAARTEKRTVQKMDDHLFHNITKAFSDMIRDVFKYTHLKNVSEGYALGKEFVVVDKTANNKVVTNHFPIMVRHYIEYKTDLRLTRDRDSLYVNGRKHKGTDANALQWSKTIKELRTMVFKLISE